MIPEGPSLGQGRPLLLTYAMRHTRSWLFVFLPFLYVAILFGLVAIQFSEKSDTFSQSLGDLTISGKTPGSQPAELVLRGRGLEFAFDANRSVLAETPDGTERRLLPLSWAWKDGNVVVSFQQGLQLGFEKADGGRSLLIQPVANEASRRYSLLRIPFGPEGGTRLILSRRGSLVEVLRDKTRLIASVDGPQDRIDDDHSFVLTMGKNGFRPARLDPVAPGLSVDLAWLTLDNTADAKAADEALTRYWNRAYSGWGSSSAFSTDLVDAWGREALLRGEYLTAFAKIQNLPGRDRRTWGFHAVSYLGNVVELTVQHRRAVEAASSRSQPEWTGQGRLWLDAWYYGPEGSADRVKDLLLSGPLPEKTPALLAVFQNLTTLQVRQPSEAVSARIEEVQKLLLTRVVRREGDLYVQSEGSLLDLRSSLILGRLWLDYSLTLANETYRSAGAQLVVSALSALDASGRLPEFLVTQEGRVVRQEGWVLPEEVYSVVRPAPAAETPLPEWGNGSFVRTPATVVSQKISTSQARFLFRFPTGAAEHLVISGVPAFDHITLHGIRWRTDPQFQSYTDGWSYSASTRTLYVKIKHREDLEELIVHFQPEE